MSEKKPQETKENAQPASRLAPPDEFHLNARTLGTKFGFDIPVSNISRTGMLLEWANTRKPLPFIENTLIEIELSTMLKGQPRHINFMGKIVRKTKAEKSALYGVQVIHTDDQEQLEWVALISSFEKSLPQV
jgi:hypothetical protein